MEISCQIDIVSGASFYRRPRILRNAMATRAACGRPSQELRRLARPCRGPSPQCGCGVPPRRCWRAAVQGRPTSSGPTCSCRAPLHRCLLCLIQPMVPSLLSHGHGKSLFSGGPQWARASRRNFRTPREARVAESEKKLSRLGELVIQLNAIGSFLNMCRRVLPVG